MFPFLPALFVLSKVFDNLYSFSLLAFLSPFSDLSVLSPGLLDLSVLSPDFVDLSVLSPALIDRSVLSPGLEDLSVLSPDFVVLSVLSPDLVDFSDLSVILSPFPSPVDLEFDLRSLFLLSCLSNLSSGLFLSDFRSMFLSAISGSASSFSSSDSGSSGSSTL